MAGKIWTPIDMITLVAWLDFCLSNKVDFVKTVIQQLKESRKQHTGLEYEFDFLQAKNKLTDLARNDPKFRGSKQYPRLEEIYSKGSVCFPRFKKKFGQEIEATIEKYQASHAHSQPQTATSHPNVTAYRAAQSSAGLSTLGSCILPPTRIVIRKGDSRQNERRSWQQYLTLETSNDEPRSLESLWEAEVATLHGQKADLEKRIQKLMAMLQHSDNARQERESAGKDPKESLFRYFHQQLWDLEQRNSDLQSAAGFFELNPSQNRSLQFKDIEASMDQIQSELELILGNCDTTNFRLNTTTERGSDLEALLLSTLNIRKTPQDLESRLKECISEIEAPVVVRTLVLAALQDWVFNTSFPPFTAEGATSLFLKSIEETAMAHGGWAWLRNFETAAYSKFLERPEFQEGLLPRRSRLLADRLSKATANFLIPASSDNNGCVDGPEVIDAILGRLHFRFIEFFLAGLKFKAATAATDNRYEFVIHHPRTLSNENGAKLAPGSTSKVHERFQTGGTNISWFHASLKVYDAGPADLLDPQSDAIVQTNNFVPRVSKTNCRCIFSKDITIEKSETRLALWNLQNQSPFGTVGTQQEILPLIPSTNRSNNTDVRSSDFDAIGNTLQRGIGKSNQAASVKVTDDRSERTTTESSLSSRTSQAEAQFDEDNGSSLDLTSVGEVEAGIASAEQETTTSDIASTDEEVNASGRNNASCVCLACGTKVSCKAGLLRHQNNKSCRRCTNCEKVCRSNIALKEHQKTCPPASTKRRRLSQDDFSSKRVNLKKVDASVCGNCSCKFASDATLQIHINKKACLKCFKCKKEFTVPNEIHDHMKMSHGLHWSASRWKRLSPGEQVEGQLLLNSLSKPGTSESTVETPRSRASTVIRREPTPNSRHLQRIIADVAKVDDGKATATAAAQTKIMNALANFGKTWSAPLSELGNPTVRASTSSENGPL